MKKKIKVFRITVPPYFPKYRGSLIKFVSGQIWARRRDQPCMSSWHLSLEMVFGNFDYLSSLFLTDAVKL